jgi:hypothetical protein
VERSPHVASPECLVGLLRPLASARLVEGHDGIQLPVVIRDLTEVRLEHLAR